MSSLMPQTVNACGPLWRIDGPRPVRPPFGLLQTAEAPAAGVTVVTDVDADGIERWANGVTVYPFPERVSGGVWAPYAPVSERVTKGFGAALDNPQFDPMTAYIAETCSALKVVDQAAYRARATMALEAVQSSFIAEEFVTGNALPLNPNLTNGVGTFPNGSTVTSPWNGLALLEQEIAKSGQLGLVHMSPAMMTSLSVYIWFDPLTKVLRTPNGNVVVPDAGYGVAAAAGVFPVGRAAPGSATQEWVYATGPIEIRLSEILVVPDALSQAMDRGSGGAGSIPNSITYRAERYAVLDWDTQVQAAVLVDRCQTTC